MSNPDPQAAKASTPTLTDLHNANVGFMNRLRDVISTIARIRKAFTEKYSESLDAVNTMTLRRRGRVVVIPRLISDLHTFLRPLLDFFSSGLETGFRGLDPFSVSLLWQLPPSATAISRMKRITEATLTSRLLTSGRIPFTPFVLWRPFPSPPDVMRTTIEETSHISDLSARIQKPTPSFTIRIVPSKSQRAAFPPEAVEAVRERDAFSRGASDVTARLMKGVTPIGLSEKRSTPTVGPPPLAYAQRHSAARDVVTAYGRRVLASVSRVFEAYATRIRLPVLKVYDASRLVSAFPLTDVVEAAPPIVPKNAKRGHEFGPVSPRGLMAEPAVWPVPAISHVMAYEPTLPTLRRPLLKEVAGGFGTPGYRMAIHVAGMSALKPLRLESRIIQMSIAHMYRDALRSVEGIRRTDIVEAGTPPRVLEREALKAYSSRVLAPVSRVSEAPRRVGRFPLRAVIDEARFPPPDIPLFSPLPVDVEKARGLGFPIPALVSGLRPLTGGEAKSLDRTFLRPESPPSKVFTDQTEIPRSDEGDAWPPSLQGASRVTRSSFRRLSSLLLREEVARKLAVIPPLVKAATATTPTVPRPPAFASRTDWLMTPVSPLLMELGFGIAEAKQLYPAVEAVSGASRAFDVSHILPREALAYQAGTKEVVASLVGLLQAPAERYTLERIPLEAPRAFPTVKLPEMMSLLSSVRTPTRPKRPPQAERVKTLERPRSIEVKVEPPRDERDLRELRRKITRILREEARRHGVY